MHSVRATRVAWRNRCAGVPSVLTMNGPCTPAARGINPGNVVRACTGVRPLAHGYVFEYDEPSEVAVLEGEAWAEVDS